MPNIPIVRIPLRASGLLVLLSSLSLPAALRAQQSRLPAAPPPGTTVQLEVWSGKRMQGALVGRIGADVVLVMGAADSSRIPASDVIHSSRFDGRRAIGWSAVGKGAAVGGLVGLTLLGIVASDHSSSEYGLGVAMATTGAGALTAIGAAVGGVVALIPEDHWIEFDPTTIEAPLRTAVP